MMGGDSLEFAYTILAHSNGLGDRRRHTVPSAAREAINTGPQNYTLDIAAGLTQVLSDEVDAKLYGVGRECSCGWHIPLGSAEASVRRVSEGPSPGGAPRVHPCIRPLILVLLTLECM